MDLSKTNTVGTAPDLEETVESSPDVAPDGSIAGGGDPPEINTKERESVSVNRSVIIIGFILGLAIVLGIVLF